MAQLQNDRSEPDSPESQSRFDIQKHWSKLAAVGVWIMGIIGGFISPPPVGQAEGLGNFVRFVVTVFAGIIIAAMIKFPKRKHGIWWLLATVVLLILSVVCYLYNWSLAERYVIDYEGQTIVIGDEFIDETETYCQDEYGKPCSEVDPKELLLDYGSEMSMIWTHESVRRVNFRLALTYILIIPVFAAAIMCVTHTISCYMKNPEPDTDQQQSKGSASGPGSGSTMKRPGNTADPEKTTSDKPVAEKEQPRDQDSDDSNGSEVTGAATTDPKVTARDPENSADSTEDELPKSQPNNSEPNSDADSDAKDSGPQRDL